MFIQLYYVEATRLRDPKGVKYEVLYRNVACQLASVEQSFLIKTEGLDGPGLHFTVDNLNPTADQFQSAAPSQTNARPVPRLALSTVTGASKGKKIPANLVKRLTLEERVSNDNI